MLVIKAVMKRKLLGIVATSLLAFSVVGATVSAIFSFSGTDFRKTEAENEEVTFSSIAWNNIDYSSPIILPSPETHFIPQYGYCIMLAYSKKFNPVSSDNFAYTNLAFSSHIKVNGQPLGETSNAVAKIASGNLFVYFASSNVIYTNDYYRPTVEIDEGTTFYGLILPYNRFEYKDSIGKNGKWENTTGSSRANVTYSSIEWNNTHQNDALYPALGSKDALLLNYSANLSTNSSESGGVYVQDRNLVNTDVGEKILLNGERFKDIEGAEIRYFGSNKLWLYAPNMTISTSDRFARIEIQNGAAVFDKILPSTKFYFVDNAWSTTYQKATFASIAWNNIDYWKKTPDINGNGIPTQGYMVALQYNENIGPGSTQSSTTDANMATNAYDIGSHLLINGVPCKDISGAIVGSYFIAPYLYVYFPDASITYTDEYDRPTIEIEEDTIFYNYLLPSIKIEFCSQTGVNNKWELAQEESEVIFTVIDWNNTDYGAYGGKKGLLLSYNGNLSNSSAETSGQINTKNFVNTYIGQHFKSNGIPLSNISGAEIKYYSTNHLWVYTPNMTIASDGYATPNICLDTPTAFLDVIIPCINLNFGTQWVISEDKDFNKTSFSSFYSGHNNLDLGNGYRDTILCFDKNFAGSDKNNTNLISIDADFVKKATLNGIPYKEVPGIYAIYVGNNYIHLMIREVDLVPTVNYPTVELHIPQDTLLFDCFINEITFYLNSSTNEWMVIDDKTIINTLDDATFKTTGLSNQIAGMCFENRLNKAMYDAVVDKYGINNVSFGTYIVPKSYYLDSGANNPIEFVNTHEPGSSTYVNVVNKNKDFINSATASSDGYYKYTATMYNIKASHYAEGFIGIGYISFGGRTYYGNISDNATTYYDLLVQAYSASLIDSSYFNSVISFDTTADAYELVENSVVGSGHTISYAKMGYYRLQTSKEIRTIAIDGVPYKVNVSSGADTYFSYYNHTIDFRSELKMAKGLGEPIYEFFQDNVNTYARLNSIDNNSTVNQYFGADAYRIWVNLSNHLAADHFMGATDRNGNFNLDPAQVALLHDCIDTFISKGATTLTLYIDLWAYDHNSPCFLKDGQWYTAEQAYSIEGESYHAIVPTQSAETYQKWLDANEAMAYAVAKEFPEFTYIEAAAEHDGASGSMYAPEYYTQDNYTAPVSTIAGWAMDLCRAFTKGIRRAHSKIKVMSPAASCIDNTYNSNDYIREFYNHIESSDDTYTNDWFQVMNIHPYLFLSKSFVGTESNYLWDGTPYRNNPSKLDYENYDDRWEDYIDNIHDTIMGGHHDIKKTVAMTETGLSDLGTTTDNNWKYINYQNRFNTVFTKLYTKMLSMNYFEMLSWFRMFDFPDRPTLGVMGGFYEANFGVIETNKTLKELGKKIFTLWNNGSTNYTPLINFLANMPERDLPWEG